MLAKLLRGEHVIVAASASHATLTLLACAATEITTAVSISLAATRHLRLTCTAEDIFLCVVTDVKDGFQVSRILFFPILSPSAVV